MSRDKFISDNLYNMRERFKRNQSMNLPGAVQQTAEAAAAETSAAEIKSFSSPQNVEAQVAPTPPPVSPAPVSTPRLPQISAARDNSDAAREQRDLEGRLLRDLSFIEAEEEDCRRYTADMAKFRAVIERQLNELASQNPADMSKINRLRIEYFQSRGRFDSVTSRKGGHGNSAPMPASAAPAASCWPLAVAILAGTLTVSLTMLWLFGG
ncbi:MAG: hypothetical protein J6R86_07880 [Lentisphaeria bacterium]|nr:hypothetical protein [Lentisphaeria bacterium]